MHIDFTGRTVLVTGSTMGIGLATATAFARTGARTVLNGRDEERLKAAADSVRAAAPDAEVLAVAADVATAEGADVVFEAVPEVDVLVNNAGIFASAPVLEIEDAEWRRFFEVNVLSGVRLARLYMPGMMARRHGRVVFVSSETAIDTPLDMVHYGTTKTAQLSVALGLAKAAAGTGVTVNSVLPGPTHTEGSEKYIAALIPEAESFDAAQREFIARFRPTSLLRRMIEPEEVANLILYTSSDLASATTGAALKVEGGTVTSLVP
ncbi:SDR family oxidoreductase [Streptomyces sp. RB6PN25]|uniref:SDR family oxidoreductase n=1 Tax=Streptomyces humicola TaxID=2953240 RepID=A0ABT1PT93_9ACTN|nr:SDR family oxidoreductase [Streptomyces humicola]MCQ4080894.1 SDR family oxidoreductase [Streptomyces humicola]